ncbi:MAG: HAD hydrolase-like protein [Alphaproteobacteria bacterium]|nr:HAD hydrolase-like protein [Alphaproteobacteria bacterium]
MVKVILWDWDNTLVDTFDAIWNAQNAMRVHYGLPEWTKEEAKTAMNQSGRNLIKNLVGEEKAKEARAYYLEQYAKNACHLKLKKGAVELLDYAKSAGYINILASNKAKDILCNEVNQMGILKKFDKMIGAEEAPEDKPSKIFTDKAIEGWDVNLLISIGDGLSDVKMARNYPDGIAILTFTDANSKEFKDIKPDYCAENLVVCKKILASLLLQDNQKEILIKKKIQDHVK